MITKDNFYKQHLVCAKENNYEYNKETGFLNCKKGGGGECKMARCLKIHNNSVKKIKDKMEVENE